MQKQIILSEEEYDRLCLLGALALQLNDKYIEQENKKPDMEEHVSDSPKCDPVHKQIFTVFVYMDRYTRSDIFKQLPKGYKSHDDSAVNVDGDDV